MRDLDLAALQIFKTVAEEGGITRAAAKLHRVQSNVTTRVKQLEAKLGTPLFLRQSRKLVLSPEGRTLLAYADQLLRLSSEAQAMVQGGVPRGTLKLGTLESTAASRLPPILSRYHLAYPQVGLELVTGTTGALITKVLNYEVEAAFVAEPFAAKNLDSQPAFEEQLVLIAPTSFPRIKAPTDIGRKTVIAFTTGCAYRRRLEDWLARARRGSRSRDGVQFLPRHRRLRRRGRRHRHRPALGHRRDRHERRGRDLSAAGPSLESQDAAGLAPRASLYRARRDAR